MMKLRYEMIDSVRGRARCRINAAFRNAAFMRRRALPRTHPQAAFTLAEVMAALVFMAILIPVALEGLSIASRAGEVAARKSDAALVAEGILNERIVTTNWNSTLQSGVVRQGLRDFKWTLHNDPWNQDPTE